MADVKPGEAAYGAFAAMAAGKVTDLLAEQNEARAACERAVSDREILRADLAALREENEHLRAEVDRERLAAEHHRRTAEELQIERDGAVSVLDRIREAHRKHPGCAEFGMVVEEILHREFGCGNAPEGAS